MINKTKPHSPEAETAVIASCLLKEDGSVYDEVSQIVTPADFYMCNVIKSSSPPLHP
jgi:replicative DNA helicase